MSGEFKHDPFTVVVGLRQGCVLLFFFISYMKWIYSHSRVDEGITIRRCRIDPLLFADDMVLLASLQQSLQHALDRFQLRATGREWKSILKIPRYYVFTNSRQCMLQVSGNTRQQVEKCKHLVVVFASDERWRAEIDTQIGKANAVLRELYRSVITKRELSNATKLSVFKSVFVPILTCSHGC